MRVIIFIAYMACISFCSSAQAQNALFNMDSMITEWKTKIIDSPFPLFVAKSAEGTVTNELFRNKVVLINFWFETCHGCMMEMDSLNSLYKKLKSHRDFLFASFTFDDTAAIRRVTEKYGIQFKVFQTSNKECGRMMKGQSGYPTTMILDKNGKIRFLHGGGYDVMLDKNWQDIISSNMYDEVNSLLR